MSARTGTGSPNSRTAGADSAQKGFGRLIRTKKRLRRGRDSRIHAKRYGKDFIKYLPRCKGAKSVSKIRSFLEFFEPYDGGTSQWRSPNNKG